MAMLCKACNYDRNPDGSQFCEACGEDLSYSNSSPEIRTPSRTDRDGGDRINIYPPSPPPIYREEPTNVPSSPKPIYGEPANANIPPTVLTSAKAGLIPKQAGSPVPEFILDSSSSIIGRFDPDTGPVEVDLEKFYGSETVSCNHGEIYLEGGQWQIKDLGSTNGIFIKPVGQTRFGARINRAATLNSGDEIAIGKVRLLLELL